MRKKGTISAHAERIKSINSRLLGRTKDDIHTEAVRWAPRAHVNDFCFVGLAARTDGDVLQKGQGSVANTVDVWYQRQFWLETGRRVRRMYGPFRSRISCTPWQIALQSGPYCHYTEKWEPSSVVIFSKKISLTGQKDVVTTYPAACTETRVKICALTTTVHCTSLFEVSSGLWYFIEWKRRRDGWSADATKDKPESEKSDEAWDQKRDEHCSS